MFLNGHYFALVMYCFVYLFWVLLLKTFCLYIFLDRKYIAVLALYFGVYLPAKFSHCSQSLQYSCPENIP